MKNTERDDELQRAEEEVRFRRMRGYHETGDLTPSLLLQSDHESMEKKIATDIKEMVVPPVDGEAPEDVTDWEATARAIAMGISEDADQENPYCGRTAESVVEEYRVLRDQD